MRRSPGSEEIDPIVKGIYTSLDDVEPGYTAFLTWLRENLHLILKTNELTWEERKVVDKVEMRFETRLFKDLASMFEFDERYSELAIQKIEGVLKAAEKQKDRLISLIKDVQEQPDEIREKAIDLLKNGDPYEFVFKTWQTLHKGDAAIGKTLLTCAASTMVLGRNGGLHFKPSGESGKGKTSGIDSLFQLLPRCMYIRGSISDKFIFYAGDEIGDGTLLFMDDRRMSPNLEDVVKNTVSNYQRPEKHRTVIDGKSVEMTPAKRITWLFAAVEGFDDKQLNNRFLESNVDESPEQDDTVAKYQREAEIEGILQTADFNIKVCRCLFSILKLREYNVIIPFAEAVEWYNPENRRNQPKFLDIIRAVCVFKVFQRKEIKGYTLAGLDDFNKAMEIYALTARESVLQLTKAEQDALNYFIEENEGVLWRGGLTAKTAHRAYISDIALAIGKSEGVTRRIIAGRPERGTHGLCDKVFGFFSEKEDENPHRTVYYYLGTPDFSAFEKFAGINAGIAREVEEETIDTLKSKAKPAGELEDEIKKHVLEALLPLVPDLSILFHNGGKS